MHERQTENITINEASSLSESQQQLQPEKLSDGQVQNSSGSSKNRSFLLCIFVLLMFLLGSVMIFRGVEEAGALTTIFIESVKPRFFFRDPLDKYDQLVEAATKNMNEKHYKAAILLVDAAAKETMPFGPSNVYLAYLLSLKGECIFRLGNQEAGRSLVKQSIRMWHQTRGPRTTMIASAWRLLSSMYFETNKDIARKCMVKALWSWDHSLGPLSEQASYVERDLKHFFGWINPHQSNPQHDDRTYESGGFFVERIKKYEEMLALHEDLLKILDQRNIHEPLSSGPNAISDRFNIVNHKYPCEQSKLYYVINSILLIDHRSPPLGLSVPRTDAGVYNLTLKGRVLNRQATLLHLLGRHQDAEKYEQRADAVFAELPISNEANFDRKALDYSASDWIPRE